MAAQLKITLRKPELRRSEDEASITIEGECDGRRLTVVFDKADRTLSYRGTGPGGAGIAADRLEADDVRDLARPLASAFAWLMDWPIRRPAIGEDGPE
jgi:hypothetical protein